MKAKYLGHDEDGAPRRVEFAGASFPKGVFVDVSHLDHPSQKAVREKLVKNPYFETSEAPMTAEEKAQAEALAGGASDGAGEGGAAAPAGKAEVLGALEAIQAKHPDFTFNPKGKLADLRATLEAAQFEYGDE